MKLLRLLRTLCFFVLLLGQLTTQAQSCDKLVFNQYCLGGNIDDVARAQPGFVQQQREGDRLALVYFEDRDTVYVLGYKGRVYKVVRKYQPETPLKYDEIMGMLTAKYGPPQDNSYFPSYVRNQASRLGAIRRGDGKSVHVWMFPKEHWGITLSWTRELGLSLAYTEEELMDLQRRLEQEGL